MARRVSECRLDGDATMSVRRSRGGCSGRRQAHPRKLLSATMFKPVSSGPVHDVVYQCLWEMLDARMNVCISLSEA